jgi:hypothetical protein
MNRLSIFLTRRLALLAVVILLAACNIPSGQPEEQAAELPPRDAGAWIDAPLHGALAPPSTPIKVIGHVDSSVGQAHLYINGVDSGLPSAPILGKMPPAYEWLWQPAAAGVYFLRVGGAGGPLSTSVKVTITSVMPGSASFYADKTTVTLGDCTLLHWTTENALEVLLDDEPVDPEGEQEVCPEADQTYVLTVQYPGKRSEELFVDIEVIALTETPTITPTATTTPTPTSTTYIPPAATLTPTATPTPTNTATESDNTPPSAPTGLAPCGSRNTPVYVNSPVNLSWNPVSDPSGVSQYQITLYNINSQQTTNYYSSSTSYSASVQEAVYYWQVRAEDGAGNWGSFSQICYFYFDIVD